MSRDELAGSPDNKLSRMCLAGYFFVGSVAVLLPSILPLIIRDFRLSLGAAGVIFPVTSAGSLLGGLLGGICSDRLGRRPFIAGSASGIIAGLLVAVSSRTWPWFVTGFLLIGVMQGALSIALNALVLDLNVRRHGSAINTLHGTYSVGAMISPLLIGWALAAGTWKTTLVGVAVIWLALGLVFCGFRYPSAHSSGRRSTRNRRNLSDFGVLLPLLATAFLYNGISWSLLGWMKVYLQQAKLGSGLLASGMLSLFYAGLALGRFLCARVSEQTGYGRTLLVCATGAALGYPLVAFTHAAVWMAGGVFLSGLFLSGLYPTAIAYGTRRFPAFTGTISGSMSAALTVGSMVAPWWTGLAAETHGMAIAIRLNTLLIVPLVVIAWYLARREKGFIVTIANS